MNDNKNISWNVLLGPYKLYAFFLLSIMLITALCEALSLGLIVPFIGSVLGGEGDTDIPGDSFFDTAWSKMDYSQFTLLHICVILVIIFTLKNGLIYLRAILNVDFSNAMRLYWTSRIMDSYVTAGYDYIISHKRGKLINNLLNEPLLGSKFIGKLINYISQIFMAMGIYIAMLVMNWKITLILSIFVIAFVGIYWITTKNFSIKAGEQRLALNQEVTAEGEQALNGIRQVKLFSLEKEVCEDFSYKILQIKRILVKIGALRELPMPFGETMIIVCLVLGVLFFEYRSPVLIKSVLPLFAFLVAAGMRLYKNVAALASARVWFLSYVPSLKLISGLLHKEGLEREDYGKGENFIELKGDIEFKDVTFSYTGSEILFNKISLTIPHGEIVAFVGKSGSGKSTLADLICSLYKGYTGNIYIGDVELRNLSLSSWRKRIGFVSQDTFLFHASIRENIIVGKRGASEEEIEQSAIAANAHDFIKEMPQGYDTIIGDRGEKLSGGQRQRITIARALIRNPELLIFDEATSALDTESEQAIQKTIESMRGLHTVIVIAHRLSTIQNADLIYVLDQGRIIETGSYKELIKRNGVFHDLYTNATYA